MFDKKNKETQDHNKAAACRQQLEEAITKTCNEFLELQIQTELASKEKLQKLVLVVKESKEEVEKVRFKM